MSLIAACHPTHELAAKKIIERVGKKIILGVPLGVCKPVGLINALYRLASSDSSIQFTIITGLTLARPTLRNELEKRLVEPILERMLGNFEDPLYERARELQQVPANIRIIEFFLSPGKYLHNNYVQQNYINSNYTTVVRDTLNFSVNVLAQQVVPSKTNSEQYSLSCNSDLFIEVAEGIRKRSDKFAIVAEVNKNLPFMYGDAVRQSDFFTDIVDSQNYPALFAIPRDPLSVQDHLIGVYTSALIKDDGCLQVGIGKLSNAVANALIFRHQHNDLYRDLCNKLAIDALAPFETGLYASTEMMSDEYMQLYQAGILKKCVVDAVGQAGIIIHAGFILGSVELYKWLNALPEDELKKISMTSIARTNDLFWSPEILRVQRKNARFVNAAMMVTLSGAVVSDGLRDVQEVSGVGGQFDFVNMAQKLEDARSIINCHSVRKVKGKVTSNIIWQYPNMTIPRYLRDIVVTEYGIADCRSKVDADVMKALLNVTDSRFQQKLLRQAKKAGKIENDYEIPVQFQQNYPNVIESIIKPFREKAFFKTYPFGSDLTPDELVLKKALLYLKNYNKLKLLLRLIFDWRKKAEYQKYLLRMQLDKPKNWREFLYKRIVLISLLSIL